MWSQKELSMLSKLTGIVNCYATDEEDEFTIVRENGKVQGIFKTWAAPIIPFLDLGGLEILDRAWPFLLFGARRGLTFSEALGEVPDELSSAVVGTIRHWVKLCRENPDFFRRSLNRVVTNTFEIDKQLLGLYDLRPLDSDPRVRVGQLLSRFRTALGLMGPFYHLETIVANQTSPWAILREEDKGEGGGELDALAFFLPALFAEDVCSTDQGEVYESCREKTRQLTAQVDEKSELLWRISKEFGLDPVEVVFAAQGLQDIPVRVGGKKEDLPADVALSKVHEILRRRGGEGSLVSIARDINAEIRFNNWLPAAEPGVGQYHARYGSVCEPIKQLRGLLAEHPEFWNETKRSIFSQTIASQIENLDAESAQGRLLWTLLVEEGWLKDEFYPLSGGEDLVSGLNFVQPMTGFADKVQGARVFGDKGANLAVVSQILPMEKGTLAGLVLDTVAVGVHLLSPLRDLIRKLVASRTLEERLAAAQEIRDSLDRVEIEGLEKFLSGQFDSFDPEVRWAVRSSCFGEDDPRRPSAGIYESQLNVATADLGQATVETVKSWFSEKAVTYRYLVEQNDLPLVAVVYQPYIREKGGVVEVRPPVVSVYSSVEPSQVTSGGSTYKETFSMEGLGHDDDPSSQAARVASSLAEIFGDLDIEWVYLDGQVKVLQLKVVTSVVREVKRVDSWVDFDPRDLTTLEDRLQKNDGVYGLVLRTPVNLEKFQGDMFGVIARNGSRIGAIRLTQPVASSCHFANICSGQGIRLEVIDRVGE